MVFILSPFFICVAIVSDSRCNTRNHAMEAIFRLMVLFLFLLLPQATEGKAYCTVTVCEWGDWGRWSECDKTCGGFGKQFRRRPKAHEALCGGKGCDGEFEQEKPCNRLCHNGGTLQHDGKCSCPKDYRGSCCQNHFPSKCLAPFRKVVVVHFAIKATWSVRDFLFLLQNHVNQYTL